MIVEVVDITEPVTPPRPRKYPRDPSHTHAGASTYSTQFNKEWISIFDHIGQVMSDPCKFRCLACNKTLSCSHMGKKDVSRHVDSKMHKESVKGLQNQRQLTSAADNKVLVQQHMSLCLIP